MENQIQNDNDNALVASIQKGEISCFDELVRRYNACLYRLAFGILGNSQDAEEVVQDAFVRIYRNIHTFRFESSLKTWMQRIVINLSHNRYHWNRRRGSGSNVSLSEIFNDLENENREDFQIADKVNNMPDLILEGKEIEDRIMQGFDELSPAIREVLVLRHEQDLSYKEIADLLNCKEGTIKSRLSRGREILSQYVFGSLLKK